LLFAAWRVHGSPTEIRELYRLRFGIETSFRQMRQARIYTCTRNPRLRLFFLTLALIRKRSPVPLGILPAPRHFGV
jgi:putative transposase